MKKLIALFLVLLVCFQLVACSSVEKSDVVGEWSSSWVYNGNSFSVEILFTDKNTYTKVMFENGSYYETETGTYELDGDEVICHPDGDNNTSTTYEFDDGCLYNNDHCFNKSK